LLRSNRNGPGGFKFDSERPVDCLDDEKELSVVVLLAEAEREQAGRRQTCDLTVIRLSIWPDVSTVV
jgi:hypothetical protein